MKCVVTAHARKQFRRRTNLREELAYQFFANAVSGEVHFDRRDGSAEVSFCGVTFIAKKGRNPGEVVAVTSWPITRLNYSLLTAGTLHSDGAAA